MTPENRALFFIALAVKNRLETPNQTNDTNFNLSPTLNTCSKQYQDASNLNARIRLHREFSTNPQSWQHWLFDRFAFTPGCRVLELGCGPGRCGSRTPAASHQTPHSSSPISPQGMVAQARSALESLLPNFEFQAIDAQEIPAGDDRFDIVIASHMLYHVPNLERALGEIRRVLKPGGRLYASTAGRNNLKEMQRTGNPLRPAAGFLGRPARQLVHP